MSAQPAPKPSPAKTGRGTTVQEAVAKLIGVEYSSIPYLMKTQDGSKLQLEGEFVGLSQTMPVCINSLLRVGRHLWLVDWENLSKFKAMQLTTPGT